STNSYRRSDMIRTDFGQSLTPDPFPNGEGEPESNTLAVLPPHPFPRGKGEQNAILRIARASGKLHEKLQEPTYSHTETNCQCCGSGEDQSAFKLMFATKRQTLTRGRRDLQGVRRTASLSHTERSRPESRSAPKGKARALRFPEDGRPCPSKALFQGAGSTVTTNETAAF